MKAKSKYTKKLQQQLGKKRLEEMEFSLKQIASRGMKPMTIQEVMRGFERFQRTMEMDMMDSSFTKRRQWFTAWEPANAGHPDATNLNPAGPDEISRLYEKFRRAQPGCFGAMIRDNAGDRLLWLIECWGYSGYNSLAKLVRDRVKTDPEDLFWQVMKVAIDEYELSKL